MHEPKISRRCPFCGASIRERAFFCPECGKKLNRAQTEADSVEQRTESVIDRPTLVSDNSADSGRSNGIAAVPLLEDFEPKPRSDGAGENNTERAKQKPQPLTGEAAVIAKGVGPPARDRRYRAAAAAREVIEDNVLQRVERLRKVSSVVIDQAAYDPSVRFLLVAALLFVIFLVIVLFSKLIG